VNNKLYLPENHYIFNLNFVEENEKNNQELKKLIDKLRVYTLLRYRYQNAYIEEVNEIIKKVDFSMQPLKIKLQFKLPVFIIVIFYKFIRVLSKIKNM
jgi:hypothetical protein